MYGVPDEVELVVRRWSSFSDSTCYNHTVYADPDRFWWNWWSCFNFSANSSIKFSGLGI